MLALDRNGLSSEFQQVGTWTVPGAQQYSLATGVNPAGAGTVGLSPAGGVYSPGTVVTVTANFVPKPAGQYSLTTSASAAGAGTISPGAGAYSSEAQVQVTATPIGGYQFRNCTGVDSSNGTVG